VQYSDPASSGKAVELETEGKLNFGLPKIFPKDNLPFRGLLNWETGNCDFCAG